MLPAMLEARAIRFAAADFGFVELDGNSSRRSPDGAFHRRSPTGESMPVDRQLNR
jgi:hypothetical protein